MSRRDKYDRRKFLTGLGAGAALLPFLDADRSEAACSSAGPKRLVLIYWPEGVQADGKPSTLITWPFGPSETQFTLPPNMKSFEPYRNDLIFLDGFDYKFIAGVPLGDPKLENKPNGHMSPKGLFTGVPMPAYDTSDTWDGVAGGPSVDHYIGQGLKDSGPIYPNLCLGAWIQEPQYVSWSAKGRGNANVPEDNPYKILDKYFAGQSGGSSSGGSSGPNTDAIRRAREGKSLLDYLYGDLKRFQRALGKGDQARIDKHLTGFRAIEDRLNKPIAPIVRVGACDLPTLDPNGVTLDANGKVDFRLSANMPWWLERQFELLVALLAADATRVITFQVTTGASLKNELTFPWLQSHFDITLPDDNSRQQTKNLFPVGQWHKDVAHQDWDGHAKVCEWLYGNFANLFGKLQELDGGRLDNTTVVMANEMSDGGHGWQKVPWILAGRGGGAFKTGRNIQLPGGTPQNGLLVALANAMGVPTSQFGAYPGDLTSLLHG